MKTLRASIFLFFALFCMAGRSDDRYFGGSGDTNTHWVGYQVSVAATSMIWTAYSLDPAKRGRIKIAPATFSPAGTNVWTAIFDENVFQSNEVVTGLASHSIQLISNRERRFLRIRDGEKLIDLAMMPPEDLRAVDGGVIPDQPHEVASRRGSQQPFGGGRIAAERPPSIFSWHERRDIERIARREFGKAVRVIVCAGPTSDTAIVQRVEKKDGYEMTVESLTLKKTEDGWEVESRAR